MRRVAGITVDGGKRGAHHPTDTCSSSLEVLMSRWLRILGEGLLWGFSIALGWMAAVALVAIAVR